MSDKAIYPEVPVAPVSVPQSEEEALLEHIHDFQFSALELQLYLDTHPCDLGALALYNQYHCELMRCLRDYEARCGPLLNDGYSASPRHSWGWLEGPWPWER